MMMKRYLLIAVLILITSHLLNAQRGRMQNRMEQINAEKIAFFTERMSLTTEEAKVFWPVYNDLTSRKEKIFTERRTLSDYYRINRENLKEREIEQIADKMIELQVQETKLAEEFHKKFKAVIPAEKVLIYYQSEAEFRNYLLRRLSGGGRGHGPMNRENIN